MSILFPGLTDLFFNFNIKLEALYFFFLVTFLLALFFTEECTFQFYVAGISFVLTILSGLPVYLFLNNKVPSNRYFSVEGYEVVKYMLPLGFFLKITLAALLLIVIFGMVKKDFKTFFFKVFFSLAVNILVLNVKLLITISEVLKAGVENLELFKEHVAYKGLCILREFSVEEIKTFTDFHVKALDKNFIFGTEFYQGLLQIKDPEVILKLIKTFEITSPTSESQSFINFLSSNANTIVIVGGVLVILLLGVGLGYLGFVVYNQQLALNALNSQQPALYTPDFASNTQQLALDKLSTDLYLLQKQVNTGLGLNYQRTANALKMLRDTDNRLASVCNTVTKHGETLISHTDKLEHFASVISKITPL